MQQSIQRTLERSRSHMGQNTEDSNCSQKALGNCAVSTVQLASFVALSGHNDATDAASVRIPFRTDDSPDMKVQRPAVRPPISNFLGAGSQCPFVTLLTTARYQTVPLGDITLTEQVKQLFFELRRASAMALPRCVVSRYATAWAESLEGAMSGHQSWAVLCRYRCRLLLAEIPKGVDRNSELKLRLHLCETEQISDLISKVLGQQNSGPLRRTARQMQPQTDEQRGKRACALTA